MKPGYKTTEFWLAVGAAVLSLLMIYGVLSQDQAAAWQELITAVAPLLVVAFSYPLSRGLAKKQ
jgi:hypothetical protein